VGSFDNNVYAIDTAGRLKWKFATNGQVYSSPVLGPDGSLYVGSYDNNIYAIDTAGSLKWKFATDGRIWASPVLGPDDTLYVGSLGKNIYAIDTAGRLKWKFTTNGAVASSPVLGPDGSLYVGSRDKNIYAIDTGVRCSCRAGTFLNSSVPFTSCPQLEALCSPCPKGSYCPYRRTTATSPLLCPAGCFCNSSAMAAPVPCPAGRYNPVPGTDSGSLCRRCFSGTSCVPYGQAAQRVCPAGSYCPTPDVPPVPCPAGTYSSVIRLTSKEGCLPCSVGHFCAEGSTQPTPCSAGSFSVSEGQPSCAACALDFVAPSAGAAACTPCGVGFTSSPISTSCERIPPCVPSVFDPDKFKCFSDLAKAGVIVGYIVTFFSSLFSVYKVRVVVRERVQRLQAASIKPTLKRIVFVERALANHSKRMLLSLADRAGALGESGPGSDGAAVDTVRDLQRQVAQLQEQQQQQQQEHQLQRQELRQEMQQQRQEILQLTQQLQRLQQ
jgi:hypothetical protein